MKVHAARLAGMSRYGLGSLAARYGYEQFSGDNNEYGMAAA